MFTEEEKKHIIKLALEGKTNKEIASILMCQENKIAAFINSLEQKGNENYNPEIYNKILMNRNLANRKIIDYDLIEDVISLVMEGYTFLEIAIALGITEKELRILLFNTLSKEHSHYYNKELYQKVLKKQANTIRLKTEEVYKRLENLEKKGITLKTMKPSSLASKFHMYERVINLVTDYLDYNMQLSDQALATKYEMHIHEVQSILNGSIYRDITKKVMSDYDLKKIKEYRASKKEIIIDTNHRQIFSNITNEEKEILKRIEAEKLLWIELMLEFRISLEDIAKLNHFPEEKIYAIKNILCENNSNEKKHALDYLLQEEIPQKENTETEQKEAKIFYHSMLLAKKMHSKELKNYFIKLSDASYNKLIVSKKTEEFSEMDYQTIIHYALKYAVLPLNKEILLLHAKNNEKEKLEKLINYLEKNQKSTFKNDEKAYTNGR